MGSAGIFHHMDENSPNRTRRIARNLPFFEVQLANSDLASSISTSILTTGGRRSLTGMLLIFNQRWNCGEQKENLEVTSKKSKPTKGTAARRTRKQRSPQQSQKY
jgi:hypothetical protein